MHKKRGHSCECPRGIRRRPTLPGRFQPSTISVLRLNFCVRDGNRWNPQAIVTGNQAELGGDCCRLSGIDASAIELPRVFLPSSRLQLSLSAPSKPHRPEFCSSPDQGDSLAPSKLPSVFTNHWLLDQALDRLVSSSSIRYRTSTDDLSTLSSSRGLTCFCSGNSILQGGFTLRCLQRLSRPHFASQLCRWHDNCCTRGASIPVLSY